MGELLDRLRQDVLTRWAAPAWHPERAGDGIEGVLLARDTRPAESNRSAYDVLTIDTGDGHLAWHAAGDIAAEQLDRWRPVVGERIAVLYGGEVEAKNRGRAYRRWALMCDRPIDPRAAIVERVTAIPDVALRARVKATFNRLFGKTASLADDMIPQALVWIDRALDGTEPLDPVPGS